MKKLLALFLAGLLLLSLCACASKQETRSNNIDTEDGAGESEEGAVTELHDETATEPPEKTETEAPEPPSFWSVGYYVDDFGDETDDAYIRSEIIDGTFSNTATSGSALNVIIYYAPYYLNEDFYYWNDESYFISGDAFSSYKFRLLEYGDHRATYSSYDEIVLKFKVDGTAYTELLNNNAPNGDPYLISYTFPSGSRTNSEATKAFGAALFAGKEIKCIIEIGSSSYNFIIRGTEQQEFGELNANLKNERDEQLKGQ